MASKKKSRTRRRLAEGALNRNPSSEEEERLMKKKNLLINLPEDVFINNILLSKVLPIKSLFSLRCVCKYLRNFIISPAFINMQLKNNNHNNPLVLIKATDHKNNSDVFYSVKFDDSVQCRPEVVKFDSPINGLTNMWSSCNGLLCLTKRDDVDSVCLWNPFTKEYKDLPSPLPLMEIPIRIRRTKVSYITYGLVYDRVVDDYKIIRCCTKDYVGRGFDDNGDKYLPIITEFQVYSLRTNTWRMISCPYKSYFVSSSLGSVFVNGALHWIMSTRNWVSGVKSSSFAKKIEIETIIVAFDVEKEMFQEIQLPLRLSKRKDYYFPAVQVLRECLCVLELDFINCNVWMMMDYGVKQSWTKLFTIVSIYKHRTAMYKLLRFCENDTEFLITMDDVLLVYDPINNKARHIELREIGKLKYQSEIYIESFVSLNTYQDMRSIEESELAH